MATKAQTTLILAESLNAACMSSGISWIAEKSPPSTSIPIREVLFMTVVMTVNTVYGDRPSASSPWRAHERRHILPISLVHGEARKESTGASWQLEEQGIRVFDRER